MAEVEEKNKTKKTFLPEVIKDKIYQFELVTEGEPINYGVSSNCVVYDPVEKTPRLIRYAPGWDSIIVSDQPEMEERFIPKIDINFSHKKLSIPGIKKQFVQFMLLHDHLEGNPLSITGIAQFRLVDTSIGIKAGKDALSMLKSAISKAEEISFDDMLPYAKVIGVDTNKEPGEKQEQYEDRVRFKFMQKAQEDPKTFVDGLEDPAHKREYDIILAFEQGILTDGVKDREVTWVKSGETAFVLPAAGGVTRKLLTKFTFTPKGGEFYEQLKKQVKY